MTPGPSTPGIIRLLITLLSVCSTLHVCFFSASSTSLVVQLQQFNLVQDTKDFHCCCFTSKELSKTLEMHWSGFKWPLLNNRFFTYLCKNYCNWKMNLHISLVEYSFIYQLLKSSGWSQLKQLTFCFPDFSRNLSHVYTPRKKQKNSTAWCQVTWQKISTSTFHSQQSLFPTSDLLQLLNIFILRPHCPTSTAARYW